MGLVEGEAWTDGRYCMEQGSNQITVTVLEKQSIPLKRGNLLRKNTWKEQLVKNSMIKIPKHRECIQPYLCMQE